MDRVAQKITITGWLFLCIFTCSFTLLIFVYGQNRLLPESYINNISEKLYQYNNINNHLDGVFIGTSHVYRGINPELVRAEYHSGNCTPRFYNFGIPGMTSALFIKIIDFINSTSNSKKIIYIEPEFAFGEFKELSVSDRSLYTLKIDTVIFGLLQIITRDDIIIFERLKLSFNIIINYLSSGIGISALRSRLIENDILSHLNYSLLNNLRYGYYSLDHEIMNADTEREKKLLRKRKRNKVKGAKSEFSEQLEMVKGEYKKESRDIHFAERLYIEKIIKSASSRNHEIGFIFMPTLKYQKVARLKAWQSYLKKHHPDINVINITPLNTSELYNIDLWFDRGHLNSNGADILSLKVGRIICESWMNN